MKKKMSLSDCRTPKDFDRVINRSGVKFVERHNGTSHRIYKFPQHGISVPVPQHRGEIPTGTRHSIAKMLALVGIGGIVWIALCNISSIVGQWLV